MAERAPGLVERMAQAAAKTAQTREVRAGLPVAAPATPSAWAASTMPAPLAPTPAPAPAKPPTPSRPAAASVHGPWHLRGNAGQEVVLMPGQMHLGGHAACIRTLLGSCVAITLWHPLRRIGGMCHYLLPTRPRQPDDSLDGRFGDEALHVMVEELRRHGTQPHEYVAHLYGGADTMPEGTQLRFSVGERNIEQGWSLIEKYGFQLADVDVGEDVPRTVTLTLATGVVEMRRGSGRAPQFATAGTARRS